MSENNNVFYNKALMRLIDSGAKNNHHCEFCKKSLEEHFYLEDKKLSVCPDCFEKLKEEYKWTIKDWRLNYQEDYLMGVDLKYVNPFKKYSERWDHEHCCFCNAKFMEDDYPDVLHDGYCTLDGKHWICPTCYEDFKEKFKWKLLADEFDNY